jgi:hypothetical protein
MEEFLDRRSQRIFQLIVYGKWRARGVIDIVSAFV